MTSVLVLGAGAFQVGAIRTAQAMGLRVVALDRDPEAVGLAVADDRHAVDVADADACVEVARASRVDAVVTVASEAAVRSVAAVADALGLPGPTPDAARRVTDKALMRAALEAAGLRCPRWRRCTDAEDAVAWSSKLAVPVVVKPVDAAGSRGVSFVPDAAAMPGAFGVALAASRSGAVIVEEFVHGTEMSVELLLHGDHVIELDLSDKVRTPEPYLLDTAVLFPSVVAGALRDEVLDVARRAVEALGVRDAAVHMELLLSPDGPVVVEVAARGAGFHVFTGMLPWVTGGDPVRDLISIALGEPPTSGPSLHRGAVLTFPAATPGTVVSVEGLDEVRGMAGILDVDVYVRPGDEVRHLRSGADRIAHVIALGDDRAAAEALATTATARLVVRTTEDVAG